MLFAPGRIWEGETAVVVAGGPSLTLAQVRAIGIAHALGRCRVIAVSDAVYPCWFADICLSSDAKWWDHHHGLSAFRRIKISRNPLGRYDVQNLNDTGPDGFDPVPGNVRHGSNSGYQAVHVAAQLGAKTIIIVGMDFSDGGARDHWFGLHQGRMDMCSDTETWRQHFRTLTDALDGLGVVVLNASTTSTITWLPACNLEHHFAS